MTKKDFWNLLAPTVLMLAIVAYVFVPPPFLWRGFHERQWQNDRDRLTKLIDGLEHRGLQLSQEKMANELHIARLALDIQHDHSRSLEDTLSHVGILAVLATAIQIALLWQLKNKLNPRVPATADSSPAVR